MVHGRRDCAIDASLCVEWGSLHAVCSQKFISYILRWLVRVTLWIQNATNDRVLYLSINIPSIGLCIYGLDSHYRKHVKFLSASTVHWIICLFFPSPTTNKGGGQSTFPGPVDISILSKLVSRSDDKPTVKECVYTQGRMLTREKMAGKFVCFSIYNISIPPFNATTTGLFRECQRIYVNYLSVYFM